MKKSTVTYKAIVICVIGLFLGMQFLNSVSVYADDNSDYEAQRLNALYTPLPDDFSIPEDIGVIKETFSPEIGKWNGKTVLYIQDAHCVYEAQMNIAKVIDLMQQDFGLRVVALEGGAEKLDPFVLRSFPDENLKKQIAESYVKKGELSGAEYASIVNKYSSNYYGIEDMELYRMNKDAYLAAMKEKESIERRLDLIDSHLRKIMNEIASDDLKEIFRMEKLFEAGECDILSYIDFMLKELEKNRKVNDIEQYISENYRNIEMLLEARKIERLINFVAVERQIGEMQQEIAGNLKESPRDLAEFENICTLYRRGEIERNDFVFYLWGQAKEAEVNFASYTELLSYITHIEDMERIEGQELFREIDLLTDEVKTYHLTTENLIDLDKFIEYLRLLRRLSALELTRKELSFYNSRKDEFKEIYFWDFINKVREGFFGPKPGDKPLESMFGPHRNFYEYALERDRRLHENLINLMRKENADFAVMVTGGFHANGIKAMLKQNGFAYAIVMPRIVNPLVQTNYHSIMHGDVSYKKFRRMVMALSTSLSLNDPALRFSFAKDLISAVETARTLTEWRSLILENARQRGPSYVRAVREFVRRIDMIIEQRVREIQKVRVEAVPDAEAAEERARTQAREEIFSILKKLTEQKKQNILTALDEFEERSERNVEQGRLSIAQFIEIFGIPVSGEMLAEIVVERMSTPIPSAVIDGMTAYLSNRGRLPEMVNDLIEQVFPEYFEKPEAVRIVSSYILNESQKDIRPVTAFSEIELDLLRAAALRIEEEGLAHDADVVFSLGETFRNAGEYSTAWIYYDRAASLGQVEAAQIRNEMEALLRHAMYQEGWDGGYIEISKTPGIARVVGLPVDERMRARAPYAYMVLAKRGLPIVVALNKTGKPVMFQVPGSLHYLADANNLKVNFYTANNTAVVNTFQDGVEIDKAVVDQAGNVTFKRKDGVEIDESVVPLIESRAAEIMAENPNMPRGEAYEAALLDIQVQAFRTVIEVVFDMEPRDSLTRNLSYKTVVELSLDFLSTPVFAENFEDIIGGLRTRTGIFLTSEDEVLLRTASEISRGETYSTEEIAAVLDEENISLSATEIAGLTSRINNYMEMVLRARRGGVPSREELEETIGTEIDEIEEDLSEPSVWGRVTEEFAARVANVSENLKKQFDAKPVNSVLIIMTGDAFKGIGEIGSFLAQLGRDGLIEVHVPTSEVQSVGARASEFIKNEAEVSEVARLLGIPRAVVKAKIKITSYAFEMDSNNLNRIIAEARGKGMGVVGVVHSLEPFVSEGFFAVDLYNMVLVDDIDLLRRSPHAMQVVQSFAASLGKLVPNAGTEDARRIRKAYVDGFDNYGFGLRRDGTIFMAVRAFVDRIKTAIKAAKEFLAAA